MSSDAARAANLQVLPGFRRVSVDFHGIRIAVARREDAPFAVDAEVLEEDTWLALSAPPDLVTPPGHPVRVMTNVWAAQPTEPGTVIARRGRPLRLLAVVHDLNAEPSWREDWIRTALTTIFDTAAREGVRALQLPMLATRHGKLEPQRFMRILRDVLMCRGDDDSTLRAIWLVREDQCGAELLRDLEQEPPQ